MRCLSKQDSCECPEWVVNGPSAGDLVNVRIRRHPARSGPSACGQRQSLGLKRECPLSARSRRSVEQQELRNLQLPGWRCIMQARGISCDCRLSFSLLWLV